mgnify:FL=1
MVPPIRTNLDNRMNTLRSAISEFFDSIISSYNLAINGIKNFNEGDLKEIYKLRKNAQKQAEYLSQDLLLVLTLNQPLLQDLRIIASYLRGVDVIERLARHARDIADAQALWHDIEDTDTPLLSELSSLGHETVALIEIMRGCLVDQEGVPEELLKEKWITISELFGKISTEILEVQGQSIGGREGRILLNTMAKRFERSSYNLMRLADLWHYALENEWIHLESVA